MYGSIKTITLREGDRQRTVKEWNSPTFVLFARTTESKHGDYGKWHKSKFKGRGGWRAATHKHRTSEFFVSYYKCPHCDTKLCVNAPDFVCPVCRTEVKYIDCHSYRYRTPRRAAGEEVDGDE